MAQDTIKIGLMAPQEGVFTEPGNDGIRGFELALAKYNGEINGKKIEWVLGPTDATPDTASRIARKLIEQDSVDFIIGPLSGSEGIALRDYAKTIPGHDDRRRLLGRARDHLRRSGAELLPLPPRGRRSGATASAATWSTRRAGRTSRRSPPTIPSATPTSWASPSTSARRAATIEERFWLPLGSGDFASIIAALPDDVDAIYLGVGGTDAINFLNQYEQAGGDLNIIGGTIMADQSVLTAKGKAKEILVGTPTSGAAVRRLGRPGLAGNTSRTTRTSSRRRSASRRRRCSPPTTTARRWRR